MKALKLVMLTAAVVLLGWAATIHAGWWFLSDDEVAEDVVEVKWADLIPADFEPPENPFNSMTQEEIDKLLDGSPESNARLDELQAAFEYAPVVESLDGLRVKLAAYVTPLEFDGQLKMSEMLLVPWMGACIHTPPPPANQVVFAEAGETIELQNAYDPIFAIGTLHVDTVSSDLAEAGYRLEIDRILPYSRE